MDDKNHHLNDKYLSIISTEYNYNDTSHSNFKPLETDRTLDIEASLNKMEKMNEKYIQMAHQ